MNKIWDDSSVIWDDPNISWDGDILTRKGSPAGVWELSSDGYYLCLGNAGISGNIVSLIAFNLTGNNTGTSYSIASELGTIGSTTGIWVRLVNSVFTSVDFTTVALGALTFTVAYLTNA